MTPEAKEYAPPASAVDLIVSGASAPAFDDGTPPGVPGGLPADDLDPLADGILMAHQRAWVDDQSDLKLGEKGRRTGITFAEALDSTLIAAAARSAGGDNTWYIGDTKDKGLEFIAVCARFARHVAAELVKVEEFLFEDRQDDGASRYITAYRVRFASGFQVAALSSRPANIRGLQGRVVIDEAAFHPNVRAVIDACNALLSRDDGRTVTADAATDKLTLTAHGFANGDRVFFTNSGGALPGGSDSKRLYHVVGAAANDYQIALTAGGAAVDLTSAGTGTHKVHKAAAVTLTNEGAWDANYNILSGTASVSGLPTGTRMMWIIETLNAKEQRVRGVAQMWG